MADWAVIINGVPGAGKTTLAPQISAALDYPLLSKDAIKEALADTVSVSLPTQDLGALSSEVMWSVASLIDRSVVIESFWFLGRDDEYFRRGLATAGIRDGVELWCEASPEVTRSRFLTRARHQAHTDANRVDEWEAFSRLASPISTFPVIRINTESAVDVEGIVRSVRRMRAA